MHTHICIYTESIAVGKDGPVELYCYRASIDGDMCLEYEDVTPRPPIALSNQRLFARAVNPLKGSDVGRRALHIRWCAVVLPRDHRWRHVLGVRRRAHPTPYRPLNSKAFCSRRKPAQGVRLLSTCGTYPMMCSTATTGPLAATCVWSTRTYRPPPPYRGTSLIRNIPLPGLYSKTVPRFPWWS